MTCICMHSLQWHGSAYGSVCACSGRLPAHQEARRLSATVVMPYHAKRKTGRSITDPLRSSTSQVAISSCVVPILRVCMSKLPAQQGRQTTQGGLL